MSGPVQLALVGLGRMGTVHAKALVGLEEIKVVAVADPSDDARAAAALLFPAARLLAEPADAFELVDAEACLLATPTPLHPDQVRAALAAGLHVLCEKPLSLDPQESLEIHDAATRAGRILQLGFWRRYAPPWLSAKEALDSGCVGAPLYMRFSQWDADPPPASFCDPAVSGGLAIDCGVHEYDLAEWFSGRRVVRVRAYAAPIVDASLADVGDVDNLVAVLELDGGAIVTVDLSRNCRYGDDVRSEILGSQGALLIDLLPAGRPGAARVEGGDGRSRRCRGRRCHGFGRCKPGRGVRRGDSRHRPGWARRGGQRPCNPDRSRRATVNGNRRARRHRADRICLSRCAER